MKKIINILLVNLLLFVFALPINAAPFEVTLQLQQPQNNIVSRIFLEWTEEIKQKSAGQLIISLAYSASITRVEGSYIGLKKGTVDMTLFVTNYQAVELPYSLSLSLPCLTKDSAQAGRLLWKLFETYPNFHAELNKDVVTLGMIPSAQNVLLSTKSLVKSIDNLKGKRVIISSSGIPALEIQALGGNPIVTASADTYIAMQRGMGDYAYSYIASVVPFKLEEVTKYATVLSLDISSMYFGVSKFLWEELPENLQVLLSDSVKKLSLEIGEKLQNESNNQIEYLKSLGIEVLVLDQESILPFKESLLANKDLMKFWTDAFRKGGIANPQAWIDTVYKLSSETE